MSPHNKQTDPVTEWWRNVGRALTRALTAILAWAKEGDPTSPRAIGLYELRARVEGHLIFNGKSYEVNNAFAEVIASQAKTITTPLYKSHEDAEPFDEETTLGSTRAYDLACLIAAQNELVGASMPECLKEFGPSSGIPPKRPRGRGDDGETRVLRDILVWWAVRHGVELGLKAERNRNVEIRYGRLNDLPSACELVAHVFQNAGWIEFTYNMAVTAWQPHRYEGEKDQRKLKKKSNTAAYLSLFEELDHLVGSFSLKKP